MISIKSDIKPIAKWLTAVQKKQIPFAASQAINSTLFDARPAMQKQMEQQLDRPTPFTIRGIRVEKATKRSMRGKIYITPVVWEYLQWQVKGGAKRGGNVVPLASKKLNKYGNIAGKRKGLLKGKAQRFGKVKGKTAVYQDKGRKGAKVSKLLIVIEPVVQYKKRYTFRKGVGIVVKQKFPGHFNRAMAMALRTMR